MEIVVEGNYSRVICVLSNNLRNRRKPGWRNYLLQRRNYLLQTLPQSAEKLLREQFQLIINEEPNPFVVNDADIDSANPEILTVKEDEDDDEDDDGEIFKGSQ